MTISLLQSFKKIGLGLALLMVMLVCSNLGFGQTNTWNGSSSNNWNTAANWSLNLVPTAAHDVVINTSSSISVDVNATINTLTIDGSASVTFTSSGAGRTITISNTGSSIASGSSLTLQGSTGSGTRSMTIAFSGSGRTMLIAGDLILTSVGEGTIYNATYSLTTVTGTIRKTSTGAATIGSITSTTSNLSFSSGGTYIHNVNGGAIPTATWAVNSTCLVTGMTSTSPSGLSQTFGNFTWNCTSQTGTVSTNSDITVNGDFLMSAGTFSLSNGNDRIMTIAGDFIQSGGIFDFNAGTSGNTTLYLAGSLLNTLTTTPTDGSISTLGTGAPNGIIVFNGTDIQTLTFTRKDAAKWVGYRVETSSTLNLQSDIQLFGNNSATKHIASFTVNGTLNTSTYILSQLSGTGSTSFSLNSGASLITANSGGISTTAGVGSVQITDSKTFSTAAKYTYNGSSAQVTGNALSGAANLTFDNASGVTLSSPVTVSGLLNLNSGIVTTSAANLLSITNTSAAAISGGNSTTFINGPVKWTLPASLTSGSTYRFPIGKGSTYLPFTFKNPTTGTGTITAQVETFTANSGGSVDASLNSKSTTEYWTLTTSGNFTNSSISVDRSSAITPFDVIAGSTSSAGTYTSLDGTAGSTGVSGSNTIGSNRYFVIAEKKKSITTGAVSSSPFCVAASTSASGTVAYTSIGVFSGATFTAKLSDASGSFASATDIGTASVIGTNPSGTINITIPAGTASGTGYRIRIDCTSLAVTGTINSTDITISNYPSAAGAISGSSTVVQGQANVSYSVGAISNATSYTWSYSGTGATITGSTSSVTISFASNATSGNLTVYGVNSCGNGTVSAAFPITVNAPTACTYNSNTLNGSPFTPCINFTSNPEIVSASFSSNQYFILNVIKGLTYQVYTCNTPAQKLKMVIYEEGNATGSAIASSTSNTGNTCNSNTNNVYSSFTSPISGQVRVLINSVADCGDATITGLTVYVDVSGGSNTQDDASAEGNDSWIGHIYDGTNNGVAYNGTFSNYLGYYTTTETFKESFGTGGTWPNNTDDDVTCFGIYSNGNLRANIKDVSFSVRYRMTSTKKGLYTVDMTGDDGDRLSVDGVAVYADWSDHSPRTYSNVLLSLSGNSSLVFDFYENRGQSVVGFNNLVQLLSNTLSNNTTQNICIGSSGSAISGDVFGTLPTGISLSGTGYQWTYSTSEGGVRTNISGATGASFTPNTSAAPFNTAGTYYLYRKAILSSANNVSPNPYVASNESNAAIINIYALPSTPTSVTPSSATSVCTGGSINLRATSAGNTIYWYTQAIGGTSIGNSVSGADFSVSPVVNTTYYAEAQSPEGCISSSRTATGLISIMPDLSAVSLSSATQQDICVEATGTQLSVTETGGGTITERQWGKRSTSGGTITPISGATSSTYTPLGSDFGAGTWFLVCTSTPTCGSAVISNEVKVVVSQSDGGTLSGGTSPSCIGSTTGTLTLTGYTGSIVRWERKINSGSWESLGNAGNTTFSDVAFYATGTIKYRVAVKNGTCAEAYSTEVSIDVDPVSVGGWISYVAPICEGSSVTLVLNGSVGSVVRWEKHLGAGAWSSVSGTSTTLTDTPSSGGSWEYRAVVKSGSCSEVNSTPVTVTVNPTLTITLGADPEVCQTITTTTIPYTATSGLPAGWVLTFNAAAQSAGFSSPQNGSISSTSGNIPVNVPYTAGVGVYHANLKVITYSPACSSVDYPVTITVNANSAVSVSIVADQNNVCSGTSVTYTATPVNGGSSPVYQWKVNGSNSGANSATFTYVPSNSDVVSCEMTSSSSCVNGNPATSNSITMTVNPELPVSISILANQNNICAGTSVNYTATATNGGTSPSYQWKVNGANVGTNSTSYSYVPADNDVVTCVLTSNATCATGNPAISNAVTMIVKPLPTALISGTTTVCPNASSPQITFTGGAATAPYTFTYKINGGSDLQVSTVSGNSVTVDVPTTASGDFIYSLVSVSDASGCSQNQTGSATITVHPQMNITHDAPADLCQYSSQMVTASVSGGSGNYTYQWEVVPSGASALFIPGPTSNNFIWITGYSLTAGNYQYRLTVTDTTLGCTKVVDFTVAIQANISPNWISSTSTVCAEQTGVVYAVQNHSGTTYSWTVTGGTIAEGDGTSQIKVNWGSTSGSYSVELTATTGSCTQTFTRSVTINALPTINPGTNPSVCSGATTADLHYSSVTGSPNRYSVDFDPTANSAGFVDISNAVLSGTTITFTLPNGVASGTYNGSLTVKNNTTGCESIVYPVSITINPNLPVSVSIAASSNPSCDGSEVTFTATPVNGGTTPEYQWKVNGNDVGTNTPTYTYVPQNGDVVICVLSSDATCAIGTPATSNTITMTVNELTGNPVFTAGATIVCQDDANETYTATAAHSVSITYSVLPAGAGTINSVTGEMDWAASFYGTATITATATGLCNVKTVNRTVTVNPLPTPASITTD